MKKIHGSDVANMFDLITALSNYSDCLDMFETNHLQISGTDVAILLRGILLWLVKGPLREVWVEPHSKTMEPFTT